MCQDHIEDWIELLPDPRRLEPALEMPDYYYERHNHREMDDKNVSATRSPQRDAQQSRDRKNCACVSSRAVHGQDDDGDANHQTVCSCSDNECDSIVEALTPSTPDIGPIGYDLMPGLFNTSGHIDLEEYIAFHASSTLKPVDKDLSESLEVFPSWSPMSSIVFELDDHPVLFEYTQDDIADLGLIVDASNTPFLIYEDSLFHK